MQNENGLECVRKCSGRAIQLTERVAIERKETEGFNLTRLNYLLSGPDMNSFETRHVNIQAFDTVCVAVAFTFSCCTRAVCTIAANY